MGKCLLSIDWDYFIYTAKENWGSYLENNKNIISLWYKRYLQAKNRGQNLQNCYQLSSQVDDFWQRIKKVFPLTADTKAYVSDSHAVSYDIALTNHCNVVYLFDAHADLGYGGLSSLNFEVNCANWLGKLFKNKLIDSAHIIYSPFTSEKPEYFKAMNDAYNIHYPSPQDLNSKDKVAAIHICRSGAWTPPWFDYKFKQFIGAMGFKYQVINCPPRKWDPQNISLSDQINYMLA
ncbi:arginase [Peptococcaceae bacterium 1198_IL3148]